MNDKPHKPVKFLHVFPSYGLGGAELRVTRTINAMGPNQGHAILSINGRTEAADHLDDACDVQVFHGPAKKGMFRFPMDLWRCIRKVNPTVIMTYNWGATDAIIGAKFARFRPLLHNECGLSADVDGKGWRRRLIRRMLLPGCHQVVVTSYTLHDMSINQYGVPAEKITFIKTGVDTQRFVPRQEPDLRAEISGPDTGVIFGYVGTLRPSKNIPMLIRAFAQARGDNDRLVLFGKGPERDPLKQLTVDLGIDEHVYFYGHIKSPERAFGAIDVNVTASQSEAASNSLLEAMATGLPVVSTDIADNKRILTEENQKFVYQHDNPNGFANGLSEMARNQDLRMKLGQLNRKRVCDEYPIERMYEGYAKLWNNAASAAKS